MRAILLILVVISISHSAFPHTVRVKELTRESNIIELSSMPLKMDSTIYKVVPAYRFGDTSVGEFLERFVDSVCAKSFDYNTVLLQDVVSSLAGPVRRGLGLSKDNPIFSYIHITPMDLDYNEFRNCQGIILTDENNIGVLYRLDEQWLEELNLVKMDVPAKIELLKYDPAEGYIPMLHEDPVAALLRIMDDGKVNPIFITYAGEGIQERPEIGQAFDWIESFYEEHNMPAGCEYYNQRKQVKLEWDGENFSNATDVPVQPPHLDLSPKNGVKGQQ